MKKGQLFNGLQTRRYQITATYNVIPQVTKYNFITYDIASSTWELTLNITYEQLCDELRKHFEVDDPNSKDSNRLQSFRNHLSTLNSFLASVGKTLQSRVGVELGSGFDATLRDYLDLVAVAQRTKRDRRSHLRLLRRIHEDLSKGRPAGSKPATSLSVELRTAVAMTGLAPKTIAKQASVSPSAMSRWLRGAMPNKRGIPPLRRLETAMGLPRNHLVNLVDEKQHGTEDGTISNPYRERLKENICDRYLLPESSLSTEFKAEWWELFNYKTGPSPVLERTRKGEWRQIPTETMSPLTPLVQFGELTCPTAAMFLQRFRAFFGAIQILCERGTLTLDPTSKSLPVTLAWLAYPKALDAFLRWQTSRSGGLIHNGQKVFCRAVKSLLRPVTGYLWQSPELAFRLPQACRPSSPEEWKKLCEAGHKLLDGWQRRANSVSRDPVLPIRHLLELDQPLAPLLEAVERIEKDAAAAPPGSVTEARLRRDALLLAMFVSNPLRSRTMRALTWSPDGTGTLHGNSASGWRLQLQEHHQKSGKGVYDVRLAPWVAPRLEAYLEEYRNTILGDKTSPYLFVATRDSIQWIGLGAHLRKITRKYIKASPGFGPHAIRHLVATNWLATHPNDFPTVAQLLNDELDTVIKNYTHLKRDSSFHRYEEHIGGLLSK